MTAILVLTGTSGSGKTTLLRAVEELKIPAVACFHCDVIYHDLPEEIRADGEVAQDAILDYWVKQAFDRPGIELAVLDTQIRPQRAQAMLRKLGVADHQVVLIECEQSEREARLRGPRGQPELANPRMENWAAYLRGQADALALPVINTSGAPSSASSARLQSIIESLLDRSRPKTL